MKIVHTHKTPSGGVVTFKYNNSRTITVHIDGEYVALLTSPHASIKSVMEEIHMWLNSETLA